MSDEATVPTARYACKRSGCRKSFQTISGRAKHFKKCTFPMPPQVQTYEKVDDSDKVKCLKCSQILSNRNNLYRHVKLLHSDRAAKVKKVKINKVFKCKVCHKQFPKKSKLERHIIVHEKETFTCVRCGACFQRLLWYNKHIAKCVSIPESDIPSMVHFETSYATSTENDFHSDSDTHDSNDGSDSDNFENMDAVVPEYRLPQTDEMFQINVEVVDMSRATTEIEDVMTDDPMAETQDMITESRETEDPYREYQAKVKLIQRKRSSLTSALNKLETLNNNDKASVIRKSLMASNSRDLVTSSFDTLQEARFGGNVMKYLRTLNCHSTDGRDRFCTILYGVYGDELLSDDKVISWLAKKLDTKPNRIRTLLHSWFAHKNECVENRGKGHELHVSVKNSIIAVWNRNSMITVDRRDGRDVVSMREDDFELKFGKLDFPNDVIIERNERRKQKILTTTKRIATKTVRQIQKEITSQHDHHISIGTLLNYKPFYIGVATEREKESCLCGFCLNIRLRFNKYQQMLKDEGRMFSSLSEFFAFNDGSCDLNINGFYKLECISGTCLKCNLTRPFKREDFNLTNPDEITFNQFLTDKYEYTNSKGVTKIGSRTARASVTEKFNEFEENLYAKQHAYLLHRYECRSDIYHWPLIKENGLGYTFHMDYSENIQNTPKHQPQDAHFNPAQHTLHCTVVYPAYDSNNVKYAYHLSEDNVHDASFTSRVIDDLLQSNNEFEHYPVIRFKSDNCMAQYCCRYIFPFYSNLSQQLNKVVLLYYGVNGHGRGLVDSMSGFGAKDPIRRAIITKDFFYTTAAELVLFLKKAMAEKPNLYYQEIERETVQSIIPRKDREELPIKGCLKTRMISFFPDGKLYTKRHICSCEECSKGNFEQCFNDVDAFHQEVYDHDVDNLDEDGAEDELVNTISDDNYSFVEAGSYVALMSAPNSFEPFIVIKVKTKDIADCDKVDFYGHTIKKGDKFVTGVYLEKKDRSAKGKVSYKMHNKDVYFYPGEIFCPAVEFDESNLSMTVGDYLFLCDSV